MGNQASKLSVTSEWTATSPEHKRQFQSLHTAACELVLGSTYRPMQAQGQQCERYSLSKQIYVAEQGVMRYRCCHSGHPLMAPRGTKYRCSIYSMPYAGPVLTVTATIDNMLAAKPHCTTLESFTQFNDIPLLYMLAFGLNKIRIENLFCVRGWKYRKPLTKSSPDTAIKCLFIRNLFFFLASIGSLCSL